MNNFVIEEKNNQGMLPFLIKLCLTRSNRECVNGLLRTHERCEVIKTCRVISMNLLISAARSNVAIDGPGFQKGSQEVGWHDSCSSILSQKHKWLLPKLEQNTSRKTRVWQKFIVSKLYYRQLHDFNKSVRIALRKVEEVTKVLLKD